MPQLNMEISFANQHLISTTITKMKAFVAFVTLLAVANADVTSHATVKHGHSDGYSHAVAHAPVHQSYSHTPAYHPAPAYKPAAYKPTYDEPAKYQYQYAVADEYAGVNFGQNESRDGYSTSGEYRVVLPDCRTQVVKYNTADGYSGNVVEVTYEGTPCYPAHKAPAYKPAPAYHA